MGVLTGARANPTGCWTWAASMACTPPWPACTTCTEQTRRCRCMPQSPAPIACAKSFRGRRTTLESGADRRMTSGWLNRVVAALPAASNARPEGDALAIGRVRTPAAARPRPGGELGAARFFPTGTGPLRDDRRAQPGRSDHRARHRRGPARPRLQCLGDGQRRRTAGQIRLPHPGPFSRRDAARAGRPPDRRCWRSAAGTPTPRKPTACPTR